jgi:hypothetical protein
MSHFTPTTTPQAAQDSAPQRSNLELAQELTQRFTISSATWHRLKTNRKARALEQAAAAIVFLLKDQPQEALVRLQQAVGWLDRSVSAPPCPTHGTPASTRATASSQAQDHNAGKNLS